MKSTHFRFKNILVLMLFVFAYKFSLDYIYINYISPIHEDFGFIVDFNLTKYIISTLVIAISVFPLKKLFDNYQKPSAIMMICLYLIYFYPNSSLSALANTSNEFFILSIFYWLSLTVSYFYMPYIWKRAKVIKSNELTVKFFYLLFILVLSIALIITISYNGFQIKFDLDDVYDLREEANNMDLPGIFGYIKPLATAFAQIGLMYFLIKKNIYWIITMIIIQAMFFALGGHKSDFFNLILSFLIFFLYSERYRYFLLYAVVFLNVITIIIAFNTDVSVVTQITTFIHRRVFYVPNILSYNYVDFFSENDLLYLRESINPRLGLENPYDDKIKYIIGKIYHNAPNMSANTGLIGDDFAQFGWFTIFIFPPLRVLLLGLLDKCSQGLDPRIVILTVITFSITFTNGAFFTVLLTYGYLMVCLLLYLMPRSKLTMLKQ